MRATSRTMNRIPTGYKLIPFLSLLLGCVFWFCLQRQHQEPGSQEQWEKHLGSWLGAAPADVQRVTTGSDFHDDIGICFTCAYRQELMDEARRVFRIQPMEATGSEDLFSPMHFLLKESAKMPGTTIYRGKTAVLADLPAGCMRIYQSRSVFEFFLATTADNKMYILQENGMIWDKEQLMAPPYPEYLDTWVFFRQIASFVLPPIILALPAIICCFFRLWVGGHTDNDSLFNHICFLIPILSGLLMSVPFLPGLVHNLFALAFGLSAGPVCNALATPIMLLLAPAARKILSWIHS